MFTPLVVKILKVTLTIVLTILAISVIWNLYLYYTYAPETRDGVVKANMLSIASDISGNVDEVMVHQHQHVTRGQILFAVDQARLKNSVASADADYVIANAKYQSVVHNGNASTSPDTAGKLTADIAAAERNKKRLALERAQLDLDHASVRSPVDGIIVNSSLQPGVYASAGVPVMKIMSDNSYYVMGSFEETKLTNIRVGDKASVYLMGDKNSLNGHVESISSESESNDTSEAGQTNGGASSSWLRLAQRIPVRIALDTIPADANLIVGTTAAIVLHPQNK